jgi:endonuclease/exonuclease/phosphatase family metal-dependent hydrolase
VPKFVGELRRSLKPGTPVILLLQEVYRAGPEVPAALPDAAGFASRIRGFCPDGRRDEVESFAAALGMHAYYVPSMRNGAPLLSDEDRGNAILSDLPLSGFSAVELPFERQRRVAVSATVTGADAEQRPWHLRLMSVHLDNMVGAKRLWIAGGEYGRARQARGLLSSIPVDESPVVVAGDFNTWFGFSDQAYIETARVFPQTRVSDRRATFHGILRLDHLFYRLPEGWRASFRRADSRFGSDHYPLVATIQLPTS